MNEKHLEDYLENVKESGIKQTTINNYTNYGKQLIKILQKTKADIKNSKPKTILNHINNNIDYKKNVVMIYKLIYKFLNPKDNKGLKEITDFFNEILKDLQENQIDKNKEQIKLYTYEEINNILKKSADDYKKGYIVLYLLLKYGVRNMDLNLIITNNKLFILNNPNYNYLYIRKNDILYIRNDYKTKKSYGVLTYRIRDKQFYKIVSEYYENNKNENNLISLLSSKKSIKPLENSSISSSLKRIYNKLDIPKYNETINYKLLVNHYTEKNNNKKLQDLTQSRGHTQATQENYYSTSIFNMSNILDQIEEDDE